jgi:hypothetical protein
LDGTVGAGPLTHESSGLTLEGVNNKLPAGLLQPIPVRGPFSRVQIDAVGPFNLSDSGKKYILKATCYFTKYAEVREVPVRSKLID